MKRRTLGIAFALLIVVAALVLPNIPISTQRTQQALTLMKHFRNGSSITPFHTIRS